MIKVDGKTYRFLGKEGKRLETVVAAADEKPYQCKYTETQPADGWMNAGFDDKKWKTTTAPFSDDESNAKKENRLKAIVENKKPQIFFLIRIRHKEIKQEEENFKIPGYSKKRLFLRQNTEAYKFTKAS